MRKHGARWLLGMLLTLAAAILCLAGNENIARLDAMLGDWRMRAEAPQLAEYARCAATWISRPRTTYMEVAISPMETNGLPSSNRRGIRASSHRCQTRPAHPW